MSTSVHQTSYDLMCRVLRGVLRAGVQYGPGAVVGIGSVQFMATAALYGLLLDHPIDRRGRCLSCRRPGAVLGRQRRRCRVHVKAGHWLHHPDVAFLRWQLASELGLATTGTAAADPEATDVLPRIELALGDQPTQPLQTPVIPPPTAAAGWPDPDHGGGGVRPERLRPRRGPSEDPSPGPGRSLLITGGITWQS